MVEGDADRGRLLEAMAENRRRVARAQADDFQYAALAADAYSDVDDPRYLLPGAEKLVEMASDGTPAVAEFCTLEVAARLGVSDQSIVALMVDALDVRHRLPGIWRLVDELHVPVWQARKLASLTRPLDRAACLVLDEELEALVAGMAWRRTEEFVRARVLELLPPEQQDAVRTAALERREVVVAASTEAGVSSVEGWVDAADAVLLDAQLNRFAEILERGGHASPRQVRRALALGILANPARALQMAQADLLDELPGDPDELDECIRKGGAGHTCGTIDVEPERLLPPAELVVHLTDETLCGAGGLARVDRVGPLLSEWVKDFLGHTRVRVRPVLDADRMAPADAYECPASMRQAVELRNPGEVFPFSGRRSAGCDLDHTIAYQFGAPGQTWPGNLGPLGRKAHRAKTHEGWRVHQPEPGLYVWTSPLGHRYLVTRSHTMALDGPAQGRRPELSVA